MSTMSLSTKQYTGALTGTLPARNVAAKRRVARRQSAANLFTNARRALLGTPTVLPMFPSVNIYTPDYQGDGFR